jgi:RNA polymerase sigma-70 factor (ECF subfamily)
MSITAGDGSSFAALVPLHAAAMLRVAAALAGQADAEDVVQEAAMRAWQAWATLRSVESVRPWLLQITANVSRQRRRGLKASQFALAQPLVVDKSPLLASLDADPGTSDHTGALDLRAAVNALPTELRAVVALRFYAGLDATEVGAALGIPAGTVRSRLHRALALIRERLREHEMARGGQPPAEGRP